MSNSLVSENVRTFIEKVISLIEEPARFTTSWFAKDNEGRSVMWDNPAAVKFDLLGAIERVGLSDPSGKAETYDEITRFLDGKRSLNEVIRDAKHEVVLEFLRSIIANEEFLPEAPEFKPAQPLSLPEAAPKKKRGRPKGSKNRK